MLCLYLLDVWGWGRGTTQAAMALGDRDGWGGGIVVRFGAPGRVTR